jgi:hypothetical protein
MYSYRLTECFFFQGDRDFVIEKYILSRHECRTCETACLCIYLVFIFIVYMGVDNHTVVYGCL